MRRRSPSSSASVALSSKSIHTDGNGANDRDASLDAITGVTVVTYGRGGQPSGLIQTAEPIPSRTGAASESANDNRDGISTPPTAFDVSLHCGEPAHDRSRCSTCRHAREHGWWGLKHGSHCRRCGRTWTGLNEIHCVRCCAHFGSPSACDRHIEGGRCTDPSTVVNRRGEPVLKRVNRTSGGVWVRAGAWKGARS